MYKKKIRRKKDRKNEGKKERMKKWKEKKNERTNEREKKKERNYGLVNQRGVLAYPAYKNVRQSDLIINNFTGIH